MGINRLDHRVEETNKWCEEGDSFSLEFNRVSGHNAGMGCGIDLMSCVHVTREGVWGESRPWAKVRRDMIYDGVYPEFLHATGVLRAMAWSLSAGAYTFADYFNIGDGYEHSNLPCTKFAIQCFFDHPETYGRVDLSAGYVNPMHQDKSICRVAVWQPKIHNESYTRFGPLSSAPDTTAENRWSRKYVPHPTNSVLMVMGPDSRVQLRQSEKGE